MPTFVSGLDLGAVADYSALVVLEQNWVPDLLRPGKTCRAYTVRHAERMPLGTLYTEVGDRVCAAFARPPLAGTALVCDQTGVGRAVVDMLRGRRVSCALYALTVTGGEKSLKDGTQLHVPKRELVGVLQVLLQTKRLDWHPALPLAAVLAAELAAFRLKVTRAANETYGAVGTGQHDDLVMALAMACWLGENVFVGAWETTPNPAAKSEVEKMPKDVWGHEAWGERD